MRRRHHPVRAIRAVRRPGGFVALLVITGLIFCAGVPLAGAAFFFAMGHHR